MLALAKFGNIPDGGGHRFVGRQHGAQNKRTTQGLPRGKDYKPRTGTAYLHTVIDDHSRGAYVEIHGDEKSQTAIAVLQRAVACFAERGVTIERVLSDNGSCYRSFPARHRRRPRHHPETDPALPPADQRQERFHRTVADGWTLARVAEVIETVTGVRRTAHADVDDSAGAVGLEPAAPGPAGGRTRRRGDRHLGQAGLAADKKSARRRGAWIVFQDESGFSLLPPVRATWAPKGQTPVLRHRFTWTRLSMSGALAYRPDTARPRWCSRSTKAPTTPSRSSASSPTCTQHFAGDEDHPDLGQPALPQIQGHEGVDRDPARLADRRTLPGYAHDLNPIEMVWGNVKTGRTGQPLPRHHRPGPRRRRVRTQPRRLQLRPVLRLPHPHRPFAMTTSHSITERSLGPPTGSWQAQPGVHQGHPGDRRFARGYPGLLGARVSALRPARSPSFDVS